MLINRSSAVLSAILLTAGLAVTAHADNQVQIGDTTFTAADWSLTQFTTGAGGTATATQTTGGNPGNCRRVVMSVNGGTGSLMAYHMDVASGDSFDLAAGDVVSISFSIDAKFISGVGVNGHTAAFAVQQGGILYYGPTFTTGNSGSWVSRAASLKSSDFVRADGLAGSPDFTRAGSPLTFGYRTSNTNNGAGAFTQTVQYDNFSVVVHRNTLIADDSAFVLADWSMTSFTTGTGGTPTATQNANGNPGTCRRVSHAMNGGTSTLQVFHKYLAATGTILPSQGGIDRIDMTLDAKYISGIGGNGQQIGIALEQGGIAYRATGLVTNSSGSWVTRQSAWLRASDFTRFDGLAGNPDFSIAGGPIQIGFRTSNSNSGGGSFNQVVSYDNWSVRVHFVQCGADLTTDGLVDDSDFVLFATAYDMFDCSDPAMPAGCPADINGDGFVDDSDFVQFAQAYDALECL